MRAKQCREFNIGLFFKRNWLFFGLINRTDVWAAKQAGKCPLDYSYLQWRVLWTASKDTKFGFDYGINFNGGRYDAKAGVKTKIADDLEFKGEGVKVEQPLVIPTGKPTLLRLGRREGKNIGLVIECVVIGPEGERREP